MAVLRFGVLIEDLGPVEETRRESSINIGGKTRPAVLYRRKGLARYIELDRRTGERKHERLADEATFLDTGGYGYAPAYTLHKEEEPAQAEREAVRQNIQQVTAQVMQSMGSRSYGW